MALRYWLSGTQRVCVLVSFGALGERRLNVAKGLAETHSLARDIRSSDLTALCCDRLMVFRWWH